MSVLTASPSGRSAPRARSSGDRSDEVAVLTPSGQDGPLAERVLSKWSLRAVPYQTVEALCDAIRRGVGVVLLSEEALRAMALEQVVGALGEQPA